MDAVYYFDTDLDDCPVKQYFRSLSLDQDKGDDKEISTFARIDAKIQFILENPNSLAGFLGTLHGYKFLEIKDRKDPKTVIRILYYRYHDKIVLLNAFDKPDNYDTQKIKKDIERIYKLTDVYLQKFLNNPDSYEIYQ